MPTGLPHSPVATGSSLAILPEPKTPSPGLQGTLRLHNPQHGHRAQGYPPVPATCWTTSASTWVHQPLPCPGLLPGVGTQQWPPQFCPCPRKPAVWWGGGSLVIQHSPAGSTLTPCHTPSWSPLVVTTSSVSSSRDYAWACSAHTPPASAPHRLPCECWASPGWVFPVLWCDAAWRAPAPAGSPIPTRGRAVPSPGYGAQGPTSDSSLESLATHTSERPAINQGFPPTPSEVC